MTTLRQLASGLLMLLLFASLGSGSAVAQFGGPYTADDNTVLLLHFNEGFGNASDRAPDAQAFGNAQVTDLLTVNQDLGSALWLKNDALSDSSLVIVPDDDALDLTGDWTIELWFQVLTYGTSNEDHRWYPSILWKRGSEDNHWSHGNYFVEVKGDTRYLSTGYWTPDTETYHSIQSVNNLIEPGLWYHSTFVRDTTHNVLLQVVRDENGELIYQEQYIYPEASEQPNQTTAPIRLGTNGNELGDQSGWCDCAIDEVRISDVVRDFAMPPVFTDVAIDAAQGQVAVTLPQIGGSALSTATLHYKEGAQGSWQQTTLAEGGEAGTYVADLDVPSGTIVYYYVEAENEAGIRSTYPAGADEGQYLSFAEPEENTLTLELDFESGEGEPVDRSSYGAEVAVGGVPTFVENAAAGTYAMDFNGETDYLEVNSPVVGDTKTFTLDFWVNPDSLYINEGRGHWQFITNKPALGPGLWGENTFEIIVGAFDNDERRLTAGVWIEQPDGTQGNVRMMLDEPIELDAWSRLIFEVREAPAGDEFDYYAIFQLRDDADEVVNTVYQGFNGAVVTSEHPVRIGKAVGGWPSHFDGKIDQYRYYNYAAAGLTVEAAPNIAEVTALENQAPGTSTYPEIAARVVQGLGPDISEVTLNYKVGATGAWQQEAMALSGDVYTATIPQQADRSVVYYYVTAANVDGATATFPAEAAAETPTYFSFAVEEPGTQTLLLDFEADLDVPADESGYGNMVVEHGDPAVVTDAGQGDFALELDGEDDFAEVHSPLLGSSGAFTLDFWLNADSYEGFWRFLVNKPALQPAFWGENTFEVITGAFDDPEPKITAGVWSHEEGNTRITVPTVLEPSTWYNVRVEVREGDEEEFNFYLTAEVRNADGDVLGTETAGFNAAPTQSIHPMRIGKAGGDRPFFDGRFDEVTFYNYALSAGPTSAEGPGEVPERFALKGNYPNPFNPATTIEYALPRAEQVTLSVFDVLGRQVMTLLDEERQAAGTHTVRVDAVDLPSGVYFYHLKAGDFAATRKMVLVK